MSKKEKSIDKILKSQAKHSPKQKTDVEGDKRYRTDHIITNGESLGVDGIDVPISGSCSGKNSMFHTID